MQFRQFKSKLLKRTIQLLNKTTLSLSHIAKDVGVSKMWLCKLKQGRIKEPSVQKIEVLHRYLTGGHIRFD